MRINRGLRYLHGWDEFLGVVMKALTHHLTGIGSTNSTNRKVSYTMSALRKSSRGFFGNAFAILGAASAAAAAVEGNRRPRARDLETLGIDPASFGKVGR